MKSLFLTGVLATALLTTTSAIPFLHGRPASKNDLVEGTWAPLEARWSALQHKGNQIFARAVEGGKKQKRTRKVRRDDSTTTEPAATTNEAPAAEPSAPDATDATTGAGKTTGKKKKGTKKSANKGAAAATGGAAETAPNAGNSTESNAGGSPESSASGSTESSASGSADSGASGSTGSNAGGKENTPSATIGNSTVMLTATADPQQPIATCVFGKPPINNFNTQTTPAFIPAVVMGADGKPATLLVRAPEMDVSGSISQPSGSKIITSTGRASVLQAEAGELNQKLPTRIVTSDPKAAIASGEFIQAYYPALERDKDGNMVPILSLPAFGTMLPAKDDDGKDIFVMAENQKLQLFVPAANSSMVLAELSGSRGSSSDEPNVAVPGLCNISTKVAASNNGTGDAQTGAAQTGDAQTGATQAGGGQTGTGGAQTGTGGAQTGTGGKKKGKKGTSTAANAPGKKAKKGKKGATPASTSSASSSASEASPAAA